MSDQEISGIDEGSEADELENIDHVEEIADPSNLAKVDENLPKGEEWLVARQYISRLGDVSALFTGCCRQLNKCHQNGDGKLSKYAASQLSRLLKSPTMLAQVFYASKTYFDEDITSRGSIEPADLAFFMKPDQIAIIIAVGYSTRRIMRVIDKQNWDLIYDSYQVYADLAVPLGFSIPAIGPTRALMAASGKFLGWGILNFIQPDLFKKYRVENKMKSRTFHLSTELNFFGTTHLHIAALIWQTFGFGIEATDGYFTGLSELPKKELSSAAIRFKVARLWLESLLEHGVPPSQDLGDDYELEESRSNHFIETFQTIKSKGSQHKWLLKNRDDIGEEKTPELIANYEDMRKLLQKRGPAGERRQRA